MSIDKEYADLTQAELPPPEPTDGEVLPRIGVQIVPPHEVRAAEPARAFFGARSECAMWREDPEDGWSAQVYANDQVVEFAEMRVPVDHAERLAIQILSAVHWHRARTAAPSTSDSDAAVPTDLARLLSADVPPGLEHPCPGCDARISIHMLACGTCSRRLPDRLLHQLTGGASGDLAFARARSEALDLLADARLRAGLPVPADREG